MLSLLATSFHSGFGPSGKNAIPNGWQSPRAKIPFWVGKALPAGTRSTRTVLDALSATNRSPFGANRMARGLAMPTPPSRPKNRPALSA
jgi:hypothetical protein